MTVDSRKSKAETGIVLAGLAALAIAAATIHAASTIGGDAGGRSIDSVLAASPIDDAWWTIVEDGTAATASPYSPSTIDADLRINMVGYSGLVVRAKYLRGETLTTAAVVHVWGKKGNDWCALRDASGSQSIMLDDAAADCDDGAVYKWTANSNQIDALGCTHVVVTVGTAAVSSAAGAVTVEVTRF